MQDHHAAPRAELPGHLAQVICVTAWSSGLVVQKLLAAQSNPGTVLFLQFGLAVAVFWAALTCLGRLPRLDRAALWVLLWGCISPGVVLLLGIAGAVRSEAMTVSVIWGLVPIVGPVIARIVLGERLHWSIPFAGAISLMALVFMAFASNWTSGEGGSWAGIALLVSAVLLSSSSHSFGRILNTGQRPWYEVAVIQMTGATLVAAAACAWGGWSPPDFGAPGLAIGMAYVALVMTLLNFVLYNFALSRIAASWVSFYLALGPAIGTLTGVLLFSSRLSWAQGAAIAVIILASLFPHSIQMRAGRRPQL